jgi:hypothetical protein
MPQRRKKIAAYAAAFALLAVVFALYAQPTILVALADQVWSCFQ